MKKTSVFSTKVFVINFIGFMLFINFLFFIHQIISGVSYTFDFQAFVVEQLPTALICSVVAGFFMKSK